MDDLLGHSEAIAGQKGCARRELNESYLRHERNQQRALASNTFEVVVDAQGRINIDEILREYAGLTLNSRVVVSGSFDRAEIWDPTRHQRISDEGLQQIAGTGQ